MRTSGRIEGASPSILLGWRPRRHLSFPAVRTPPRPIRRYELGWPGSAIEARCTTTDALASELHARAVPPLDALVELPAGRYVLGEPGEERAVALERVLIGRWPVVNAHMRAFAAATGRPRLPRSSTIRSSPTTRRPTSPAPTPRRSARGRRASSTGPCACRAATSGRRGARHRRPPVAVGRRLRRALRLRRERLGLDRAGHARTRRAPARSAPSSSPATSGSGSPTARPTAGASCAAAPTSTRGWGLRASRAQPADPARATPTTGFRIVIAPDGRSP